VTAMAERPGTGKGGLLLRAGLLVLVVFLLDQASKYWVVSALFGRDFGDPDLFAALPPRGIEVTGFLNWVLVGNTGVSFGLFAGAGLWVFIPIALIIAAFLVGWLLRSGMRWLVWPVGLIVGGAIGNVADRLRFGAVVDFIDVHAAGYHWPAFNVADSAVFIGVAIVVLEALLGSKKEAGAEGG
jgi:signal peptidase II